MIKRILAFCVTLTFALGLCITANAIPPANPNIGAANINLSTAMKATFTCSTMDYYDVSVSSVKLQVKNSNGTWSSVGSLSAPASKNDVSSYLASMDYSGSCTKGKTYRISATFTASGSSVSRTSNEATY